MTIALDIPELERATGLIDGILTEDGFKDMIHDFAKKHVDTFSFEDENKLEYTPIYTEYQGLVENYIESGLESQGVDLVKFLQSLPEYVERPEAHERTGAVIEVLRSLDSFIAFKDMMLSTKKTLAQGDVGSPKDDASMAVASFVDKSLELTQILDAGGAADGWIKTADKGWIQTYRKPDPQGGAINMTRCAAKVNMPAEAFLDIFMDPHIKTKWDKEVASCKVISGEGYDKDGYVVQQLVKIPFMKDRELLTRMQMKHDFPEPGAITAVVCGEEKENSPPVSKGALRVKFTLGNCIVRPETDKTCNITMFGHMDFHFPSFIWNHMASGWLIRNVVKIENYYKSGYKK